MATSHAAPDEFQIYNTFIGISQILSKSLTHYKWQPCLSAKNATPQSNKAQLNTGRYCWSQL